MNAHSLTPFTTVAAFFLIQSASSLIAQNSDPKGVLIFKSNHLDDSKTAKAIEYSKIKFFPAIVNGTDTKGAAIKVMRNCIVEHIEYPDLKYGSIQYPAELESFGNTASKLAEAVGKYPLASESLRAQFESIKDAGEKLLNGMILVRGTWQKRKSVESDRQRSTPSSVKDLELALTTSGEEGQGLTIVTKSGTRYAGVRILKTSASGVTFIHAAGGIRLPLSSLSDESIDAIENNSPAKQP